MRVLHLGGTGNLGSRVIPALLAHGHTVVAYVRTPSKLRSRIPSTLLEQIIIVTGDAFNTDDIAHALREYDCDALVNTAGTREPLWREQTLGRLVRSVTSAAITVGKERSKPFRAWIIGGMGSLNYPGTDYKIQDYMPGLMTEHHRGTEVVMQSISLKDLEWSLLCVAMMYPESEQIQQWSGPRKHGLLVQSWTPPNWQDHWINNVPIIGRYLNLFPVITSYRTKLEDVAALIAEDLTNEQSELVGAFVGFKAPEEI